MSSASSTRTFLTFWPCGSRLVRDELHAEDLLGELDRLVRALRELDAAALAAAAGVDLRLDDGAPAELLRDASRFLGRVRDAAAGRGDAEPAEDFLGLVFVYFHGTGKGIRRKKARSMMKLIHGLVLSPLRPCRARSRARRPRGRRPTPSTSRRFRRAAASLAKDVVAELKAEDLAALESRFDEQLKAALPDAKLRAFWLGSAREGRAPEVVRRAATSAGVAEYTLAFTSCTFERQKAELKLTFRSDGRLAGMFLETGRGRAPRLDGAGLRDAGAFREREVKVVSGTVSLPGTLSMSAGRRALPGRRPRARLGPPGPRRDDRRHSARSRISRRASRRAASRCCGTTSARRSTRRSSRRARDVTIRTRCSTTRSRPSGSCARRRESIAKRVFVAGHSLGAILAPRIGVLDGAMAGVVLLAAPSRPMSEVLRDQAQSLARAGSARRPAAGGARQL